MPQPPIETMVDDVHVHPRHVGHRWLDLILALTALLISGVSLYVAVEHGRTERQLVAANARLVEANSWPFLQMEGDYSTMTPTNIALENAGIGPAKLESFEVLYKGRPVDNIYQLVSQCCGVALNADARRLQLPEGLLIADAVDNVLRPGQRRLIMNIPASPEHNDLARRFLAASVFVSYHACYCSVFDQCWVSTLKGLHPEPVQACPIGAHDFNRGTE